VNPPFCKAAVVGIFTVGAGLLALPEQPFALIQTSGSSGPFATLTQCRTIGQADSRLNCYDTAVGALETARAEGTVVVLDRAAIQEAQRQSFGFGLKFWSPSSGKPAVNEIQSLTSTLTTARQVGGSRRWLITLEDGSIWMQADTSTPYVPRANGQPVIIQRGAFGSYRMTVGNSSAFAVRRQAPD
jgi:hypothetical protein